MMSDDATTAKTPTPVGADPANDPLAVLEDILKDAKAKKGLDGNVTANSVGGSPGDPGAHAPTVSQPSAEELAVQQAQAAAEAEAQRQAEEAEAARLEAERQQQIADQKQKIESEIKQSPQYQAAVQQEEEKQQAQASADAAGEGFEIRQIDHDKI